MVNIWSRSIQRKNNTSKRLTMWTALAIGGGIALSATVYQIMKARLLAAQSDVEYYKREREYFADKANLGLKLSTELEAELFDIKADRDQLAQALKETQEDLKISDEAKEIQDIECLELEKQVGYLINKIQNTKVTRDPKTGRMVSMKSK